MEARTGPSLCQHEEGQDRITLGLNHLERHLNGETDGADQSEVLTKVITMLKKTKQKNPLKSK